MNTHKNYQECYIRYILFKEEIIRMEHKTEKIVHVYGEKYIYIFNFANRKADYIKTLQN